VSDFRDRVFHPEDLQRLREERQKGLSGSVPFENEQRALGKDGKYRWFLIRYNPLIDERGNVVRWYATGTDIEYRKEAETKLRQEERELRQLIDFLPQHVLVLDKDGTLLQVNKTMLDYKGFTLEEMKGGGTRERINRDVHPDDLERAQNERSAGLSRGVLFETEKRLVGKDGQYRWFLFRYNPVLSEAGDIVRWFATATDIEDRKQAEDRVRNEAVALREQIDRDSMFEDIVGSSEALRKVLRQVAKVAPSDSTVLILGETGTGKELIARAIHKRSNRSEHAFFGVNCAAIPASLIASELFGHEKGAFTGATQRRLGRFESANGGTIFLDEVGDWRTRSSSVERKHLLIEWNQLRSRRILCSRNRIRSTKWKLLQHVLLECGARNGRRCHDGQGYPNPFAIEEKEQSVLDKRPAETTPEMVHVRSRLVIAGRSVSKVIRRVQD
jgi:formate hydrogenlyase transcriptional activator